MTSQVLAQRTDDPIHRFKFDPPAGYLREDSDFIENYVIQHGGVTGEVMVVACSTTDEFDAGFRVRLEDETGNTIFFVGFICDPETGVLTAGIRASRRVNGEYKTTEDTDFVNIGERGDVVGFSLSMIGSDVSAQFGGHTWQRRLPFKPSVIRFYGFGTRGVANFYDSAKVLG
ncbi:MAG: hypothetical protein AAFQ18_12765 [Pseudomonadota bacterium]